jgi:hypothetical protein
MTSLEKAARAVAFVTADHKHTSDEWWDSLIPDEQTCAFDIARAVLLAVREPENADKRSAIGNAIWCSRIDAILEKGDG